MSAAAPSEPLDLRPAEAARRAALAARREHLLAQAAGETPAQTPSAVEPVKPPRRWHLKRPRLILHPLTLGILAGVLAAFALAVIIPRQNAPIATLPSLQAPATLAAAVATPTPAKAVVPAKPVDRLWIPTLGTNAPVTKVGLVNGALDTPKTLWQVARYTGSAAAGDNGTTIIVGHSGAPGQVGVFEHINRLKAGALITYTFANGKSFNYQVQTSAAYGANDTNASQILFNQTATPSLNLVSCYGNWDKITSQYDQRWIVTATLVGG